MNNDICVYLRVAEKELSRGSLQILGLGQKLAKKLNSKIIAIIAGDKTKIMKATDSLHIDEVWYIKKAEKEELDNCQLEAKMCLDKIKPSVLLILADAEGKILASELGVMFRTGVTADCIKIEVDELGLLQQTRPAFGERILAEIITPKRRPQIATIRENVLPTDVENSKGDIKYIAVDEQKRSKEFEVVGLQNIVQIQKKSIEDASILVAIGKGVCHKAELERLYKFADKIGATIAGSRGAVEAGLVDAEYQIGLSGKNVNPELLITVGIRGSIQFLAGINRCKNIIAINNDLDAPILKRATYPVCSDWKSIIEKLGKKLEIIEFNK